MDSTYKHLTINGAEYGIIKAPAAAQPLGSLSVTDSLITNAGVYGIHALKANNVVLDGDHDVGGQVGVVLQTVTTARIGLQNADPSRGAGNKPSLIIESTGYNGHDLSQPPAGFYAQDVDLTSNGLKVTGGFAGVLLAGATSADMANTDISQAGTGLLAQDNVNLNLHGLTGAGNVYGVHLMNNAIGNFTAVNLSGNGTAGIFDESTQPLDLADVVLTDGETGLDIEFSGSVALHTSAPGKTLLQNNTVGAWIRYDSFTATDNGARFTNNTEYGIAVSSVSTVTIAHADIFGNRIAGLASDNQDPANPVIASNNWWGSATGPHAPYPNNPACDNPGGLGDAGLSHSRVRLRSSGGERHRSLTWVLSGCRNQTDAMEASEAE